MHRLLARCMLRLHHDGVSAREIGRTLGVARSTIQDNLRRANTIGIAWPHWTQKRGWRCSSVSGFTLF